MHVVLLGDSIFDNKPYVGQDDAVIVQLKDVLRPQRHTATLLAVDGAMIDNVPQQLKHLPDTASHLVLSVGGNNVLSHMAMLNEPATSTGEVLLKMRALMDNFQQAYHRLLHRLFAYDLPLTVCTIYNPRFPEPMAQQVAMTALCVFNDVVLRAAFSAGIPVIDLRLVCTEDADYANPIEPSSIGGAKIVKTIQRVLDDHDFSQKKPCVYV
jgi:hypothetical protein